VHRYVSTLAEGASSRLNQALLVLRANAGKLPTPELQAAAEKQYAQTELSAATKVLLSLWIFQEAMDQGAESMPGWVMEFLKLSLHATDYLIAEPPARQIMETQCQCQQMDVLSRSTCEMIASSLGYGDSAKMLAGAFAPLLADSRTLRQNFLRDALTEDAAAL
jgi:hypothetical protein